MKVSIMFQPKGKMITVKKGENLLQAALKNRVFISHRCGGKGSCTTCKVKVDPKSLLSDPTPIEIHMLGVQALAEGFRLACQTNVHQSLLVQIPEEAWKAKVRKLLEQQSEEDEEF